MRGLARPKNVFGRGDSGAVVMRFGSVGSEIRMKIAELNKIKDRSVPTGSCHDKIFHESAGRHGIVG